jgi:uncharacterized protein
MLRKRIDIRQEVLSLYKFSAFDQIFLFLRSFVLDYAYIAEHIPLAAKVIDVGCGYGILSNYLALSDLESHVKGIDIDADRISKANQTTGTRKNIVFEVGDFMRSDLTQFNTVVAIDLMHYFDFDEQHRIINKVGTALTSGGIFILRQPDTAPKWRYCWTYMHEFIMVKSTITKTNNRKIYFSSSKSIISVLEENGFEVTIYPNKAMFPYSDTIFVCRKR